MIRPLPAFGGKGIFFSERMTAAAGFVALFQQTCDIPAEFLTVGRFHFVYGRAGREMDPFGIGIPEATIRIFIPDITTRLITFATIAVL